jgi:hypothetical protein
MASHQPPLLDQLSNSLVERILNSPGKSAHSALRQTLKLSFLKRAVQPVKQSASAFHVKYVRSVLNMRSLMMSVSVFGVASLNVSAAA